MRKKKQRTLAIIIAALVSLGMVAPSFVLLFSGSDNGNAVYSLNGSNSSTQSLKSQADALSQAVKTNPQDNATRLNLANTYYDLAMATLGSDTPEQAEPIFKQAVAEYQEVIKTNTDINIKTDLATAAFYGGEYDLADKTFKEALAEKPNFLNALLNYGVFLMDAKNDYMGAIAQWNKALSTASPSPTDKERLNGFISMAQEKIQESFEKSGSINNPNTSTPGAK